MFNPEKKLIKFELKLSMNVYKIYSYTNRLYGINCNLTFSQLYEGANGVYITIQSIKLRNFIKIIWIL